MQQVAQEKGQNQQSIAIVGEALAIPQNGQSRLPTQKLSPDKEERYRALGDSLRNLDFSGISEITGPPQISLFTGELIQRRAAIAGQINDSAEKDFFKRLEAFGESLKLSGNAKAAELVQCLGQSLSKIESMTDEQLKNLSAEEKETLRSNSNRIIETLAADHGYFVDFRSGPGRAIVPVDAVVRVPTEKSVHTVCVIGVGGTRQTAFAGEAVTERLAVVNMREFGVHSPSAIMANELGHLYLATEVGITAWQSIDPQKFVLPEPPVGLSETAAKLFKATPRSVIEIHELYSDTWSMRIGGTDVNRVVENGLKLSVGGIHEVGLSTSGYRLSAELASSALMAVAFESGRDSDTMKSLQTLGRDITKLQNIERERRQLLGEPRSRANMEARQRLTQERSAAEEKITTDIKTVVDGLNDGQKSRIAELMTHYCEAYISQTREQHSGAR